MAKDPKSRAEQVRQAVDQAFQQAAADGARRWQDVAEEVTSTAGRVRGAIEDLRPVTLQELDALRERLEQLEARIAELEQRG